MSEDLAVFTLDRSPHSSLESPQDIENSANNDILLEYSKSIHLRFITDLSEKVVEKCQCISELPALFSNHLQLHTWLSLQASTYYPPPASIFGS